MTQRLASPLPPEAARHTGRINLLDARLGAAAVSASDEFFAPMARMLEAPDPEWRAGVYDANGKWMDGWETRRRRDQGHDHCIVRLAASCRLSLLEIDTRFFTGNYPPYASVQSSSAGSVPVPDGPWEALLKPSPLRGDQRNFFDVSPANSCTHLKLNIFPDGGVARFRAYGAVERDWSAAAPQNVDLAAALHGGRALACSDQHYGSMSNLLLPGRGISMADGWETRRRREPGFDWVILRLGHPGQIRCIEVDTAHFKGNYPHQVSFNAALLPAAADADADADADVASQSLYWPVLLAPSLLQADHQTRFDAVADLGCVSHVRVNMHPDGGMSRIRLFGTPGRAACSSPPG